MRTNQSLNGLAIGNYGLIAISVYHADEPQVVALIGMKLMNGLRSDVNYIMGGNIGHGIVQDNRSHPPDDNDRMRVPVKLKTGISAGLDFKIAGLHVKFMVVRTFTQQGEPANIFEIGGVGFVILTGNTLPSVPGAFDNAGVSLHIPPLPAKT
ncbi:MAG: hypothetical protein HLUCCA01_05450 [Bacteroidetes bacterium HLUCCA01]|nr:MAG: hypothetical protein HLUCCA01_05450 [Bacteroidetes bacterium HLUCCA01]